MRSLKFEAFLTPCLASAMRTNKSNRRRFEFWFQQIWMMITIQIRFQWQFWINNLKFDVISIYFWLKSIKRFKESIKRLQKSIKRSKMSICIEKVDIIQLFWYKLITYDINQSIRIKYWSILIAIDLINFVTTSKNLASNLDRKVN